MRDLGSRVAIRAGSSPVSGTKKNGKYYTEETVKIPRVRYLELSDTAKLVLTRVSIVDEWKLDVRLKLSVADIVKEFTLDTDTYDWETAQPIAELVGKAWLDDLAAATSTALAALE